ncbi:MAG: hypothetical protein JSR81_00335 [Proteobacteria bacterium]|nr:hypothetical protein [Pseudomonadota bacterium]
MIRKRSALARRAEGIRLAQDDLQAASSTLGVFHRIFAGLASKGCKPCWLMIDATHTKAHRMVVRLQKALFPMYRGHEGRPELRVACGVRRRRTAVGHAAQRRPGERLQGAALMVDALPPAKILLAPPRRDILGST